MFSLLRRNRNIRLVVGAQVVSYLGDWFTFVALAGLVQEFAEDPAAMEKPDSPLWGPRRK